MRGSSETIDTEGRGGIERGAESEGESGGEEAEERGVEGEAGGSEGIEGGIV